MSAPTHTGRVPRTQAPLNARPTYVEVARGEAPTPIPDSHGGLLERAAALTASVPGAVVRSARYTGEKLRDVADNTSVFVTGIGLFCIAYALIRVFTHDLLGWRPEREIVELRSETRRLQMKIADLEADLERANSALLRVSEPDPGAESH